MEQVAAMAAGGSEPLRFPCSSSQQRCWFIDALDPGSAALNVALRWEITGIIADDTVEHAFNTIVERHEVLRTRFLEIDGEPVQEVAPALRLKLSVVDLRHLPEEARDGEARKLAEREAQTPFDIHELPLIRVTLLRLADQRASLLLTVHQIVFDGWSIRVIANEFGEIAAAYDAKRAHPLPELPLQYGDYARWQREYLAVEAVKHERYWYEQLAHAPYLEVPGDFEKPARPSHHGIILAEMLQPETGARMEEAARLLGVTPFALGCAATIALIKRLTGRSDIILGTQIAGRDETELEPLIGVFINNLVLRVDTRHVRNFSELLARTNETVRDALMHQQMPFHRLVELLNPPRDPARTPLISVNFTMLKEVLQYREYGRFRLQGVPSLSAGSLYDLNFFVVKWRDGWRMAMEYNPDIFRADTARAFVSLWRSAFERAIAEPDFALDTLVPPERGGPVTAAPKPADVASATPSPATASIAVDAAIEAALAEIWQDLLQTGPLTPEADFFALGGHSLLAVRMLARVRERFGERIDPLVLFEAPTLRQMASRLGTRLVGNPEPPADERLIEPWNVVPIQPHGSETPIIAINNTLAYYNVARAIGTDRPFIGIQLFDPNAPRELEERPLADVARDYVRLIRAARPGGPYVLFGLCVAGAIAYEAGCQLEAEGEAVPLIILADTWRPGYLAELPPRRRAAFRRAYRWHMLKRHYTRLSAGETELADVLASYPKIRKTGMLKAAARLGLIEDRTGNQDDWSNRWFLPTLERARDAYRPGPFGGRVVLLRSDEMITDGLGDDMGWNTVLPLPPESHAVPGWHAEMFQGDGAQVIARHLRPRLRELSTPLRPSRQAAE
ncbi:condensation domain-containing protein [Ancylobacter oerskovii]|uniref:Condensation domain-containing protein n=1 Tax=Ancylobacter oerskovii TaxID=459519 RepID=A0ABW4Z093_9HYPH|nr:condensation domain-containing protein [Ancylobacter oerskovii]MBS7542935.1 hypothetical protein [Ancylobacter oerskovii]